jgi:chitin disaccharide deacetylase
LALRLPAGKISGKLFRMKQLILNADDFGYTRGINQAIVRAHREGVLTSATLMANAAAFDDAAELARQCPDLGVGCHFVLIGGKSVADPSEIPSLASPDGRLPQSLPAFVAAVSSGSIKPEDIARELRAQIAKIRAAGVEPTHIDSHKHTHAHPRAFRAIARTAKELGITKIRNPYERLHDSWTTMREGKAYSNQIFAAAAASLSARPFRRILREYGLKAPDNFLGLAVTGRIDPVVLREMVRNLSDGFTEIMLHPGICDPELVATGSRLTAARETEMQALLDPEVKLLMEKENVRRITFRELN